MKGDAAGVVLAGLFFVGALLVVSAFAGHRGASPTPPPALPKPPAGGGYVDWA